MKVSICTITYNHEKYVAAALTSFFQQKVNFDFEVIVSDDCSTDNTVHIVEAFAVKYPNQVKIIRHHSNIGMMANFKEALDACSGQYIALCEGDDYWIDNNKLQRQVDLLDARPEISICFHKAKLLFDNVAPFEFGDINKATKEITTFSDLVKGNYIHTPTVVYRNYLFGKYPLSFLKFKFGDWPLHLLNAEHGDILFIPEELAVYRITHSGAWSTKKTVAKIEHTLNFLKAIRHHFSLAHREQFDNSINSYFKYLIKLQFSSFAFRKAIRNLVCFFRFLITKT